MPKVGLIAGNRKFPLLVAQEAKKRHYEVIAIGIRKDTLPFLEKIVDKIYWLNLADFEKIFEIFKKENIEEIIFAGQITPKRIFSREVQRSGALREFLDNIPDKRPTNIFGKIAKELEDRGFRVLDSTVFLKEHLPAKGVLTEIIPDFPAWEDIYFGLGVARGISFLDIGQTVAVKNKVVLAVEAFEGTDQLILRAGKLAKGGFVLVKVSRPSGDMRFDIPVVGLRTIKLLIKTQAKILAFEADKTLFIDREEGIKLANKRGLCVVAI